MGEVLNQKKTSSFRRNAILLSVLTVVITMGYYMLLIGVLHRITDIQLHVSMLYNVCLGQGSVPANAGFYEVVHLLSGFTCNPGRLLIIAIIVVAMAWGGLVGVSAYGGIGLLQQGELIQRISTTANVKGMALVAALGSCLLFPLPVSTASWYVGLLPPNVYHNSTIITAMPFSIAAVVLGTQCLAAGGAVNWCKDLYLALVLATGAIFKPSYAFAFVPAYAVLFLLQSRLQVVQIMRLALAIVPVLLVILGQLMWTNHHPQDTLGGASHVGFAFLAGWHTFVPDYSSWHVLGCAVSSFLVPIVAYGLRPDWLRLPAHRLGLLSLLVGFGVFLFVYETGPRAMHGNFIWQVIAANHVLHWIILLATLSWIPVNISQRRKKMVLLTLLIIEVLCGVTYMINALFVGVY
ncbi:hypothetical protein QMK33_05320 [Hymenobacter sp. H14-R3]|uniref:hypothetical protein n=1 Tax=Hymenobacter sp. H14-R3 TaxID=3046308 RepID=UPI0024BA79F2|nr:hypothetical protein [Hymenobacter sp. H14-R3]MDJ0364564.1 hypothetical protein [Hymenobacter sp. H14-R3]